jgi:hypothetical protein
MEKKDYFDYLCDRLLELIELPVPEEKFNSVQNLICRYTSDLRKNVEDTEDDEKVKLEFKHYVKNILLIIETLISGEQYKALRRLLQNEIYSCCTVVLDNRIKKG